MSQSEILDASLPAIQGQLVQNTFLSLLLPFPCFHLGQSTGETHNSHNLQASITCISPTSYTLS